MKDDFVSSLTRLFVVMMGIGLGAGLMYILDPDRGRTRRALIRDKTGSVIRKTGEQLGGTAENLGNHAKGVVAEAAGVIRRSPITDQELIERARAKVSELIQNAGNIQVTAANGRITLSGPVLASQVQNIVEQVARMPGVKRVQNHLTVYQYESDVPTIAPEPMT